MSIIVDSAIDLPTVAKFSKFEVWYKHPEGSKLIFEVKTIVKSVNVWQSYKQERDCIVHFVCLANALLKDEESDEKSRSCL